MGELLDGVTWQNLLPFSSPVMGYTDGLYAWPPEAWQAFQKRGGIGISITGDERQPVHDCEFGAESPTVGATAAANRVQARQWAVLYSSQANLPNVTGALKSKGLYWTDAQYWPKPAVYLHIADPSGNIAAGRWQPPVTPIAIQDQWLSGMDISTCYGTYPLDPPPPTPPPLPAVFWQGGAQESDAVMAVVTHPNGVRVDLVCVGTNGAVFHYVSNDGDFVAGQTLKESLGGDVTSVSAAWTANGHFVILAQGTDNDAYQIAWNGAEWGPWQLVPNMKLLGR